MRLDRERMDALDQQISQHLIDRALADHATLAHECLAHDLHGEMGFAASIMTRMATMLFAVVDDGEMGWREGRFEAAGDFLGDGPHALLSHQDPIARFSP